MCSFMMSLSCWWCSVFIVETATDNLTTAHDNEITVTRSGHRVAKNTSAAVRTWVRFAGRSGDHSRHGVIEEVFAHMTNDGVDPDAFTFNTLIAAAAHAGA